MTKRRTPIDMLWDFINSFVEPPEISIRKQWPIKEEASVYVYEAVAETEEVVAAVRREADRIWDQGYKAALSYLVECQELAFGHRDVEPELPVNPYREDS